MIVAAGLPGIKKGNVSLQLINPRAPEISCERSNESEEKTKGYYVRECVRRSMCRMVALPSDVVEENSKASFKNGVLEVQLRKIKGQERSRIRIE